MDTENTAEMGALRSLARQTRDDLRWWSGPRHRGFLSGLEMALHHVERAQAELNERERHHPSTPSD